MFIDKVKYAKIILSQVVGFFASYYLVTNVFIGPVPIVRSDFQYEVQQLPSKTVEFVIDLPKKVQKIAIFAGKLGSTRQKQASSNVPPPWVFGQGPTPLPTNAPVQQPTLASQQPTSSEPKPTSILRLPTFGQKLPTPVLPTSAPQQPRTLPTAPQQQPTQPQGGSGSKTQQSGNASLEQQTVDEINKRRKDKGLREVTINTQLTQAARRHSADMSSKNFCGHTGSDGSDPFQRTKDAAYAGQAYGETVACGSRTAMQTVDMWWSSPPHHAILTNASIREIGLGWVNTHQTAVVGM